MVDKQVEDNPLEEAQMKSLESPNPFKIGDMVSLKQDCDGHTKDERFVVYDVNGPLIFVEVSGWFPMCGHAMFELSNK